MLQPSPIPKRRLSHRTRLKIPRAHRRAGPAAPPVATEVPPARAIQRQPDVDSRELMVSLASLDTNGPISPEDAQKWKASLQQLIRQGASSIPAIQDYLAQNLDVNYSNVPGADQLGYATMRAGLLDALGQIGGPQATQAMLQIMQTSVYPTDLSTLAATLAQQSPGQYDGQVLSAVRNQLSLASQDQLGNANVAPLFQLLATASANGTDVTPDLSQYSDKWPYYSSIELASLPNGAGVASLVQIAQQNTGVNQSAAVQALAQLAPQNSQALTSLVNMVQQGQLSDTALADLAPYLTGRQNELGSPANPPGTAIQGLHLANGNQDYLMADTESTLTPAQVTQRLSVIDQLLQAVPATDTAAQAALQGQKNALSGRQGK